MQGSPFFSLTIEDWAIHFRRTFFSNIVYLNSSVFLISPRPTIGLSKTPCTYIVIFKFRQIFSKSITLYYIDILYRYALYTTTGDCTDRFVTREPLQIISKNTEYYTCTAQTGRRQFVDNFIGNPTAHRHVLQCTIY